MEDTSKPQLHIHTAVSREFHEQNPSWVHIDVSDESGDIIFAPNWEDAFDFKTGAISKKLYELIYLETIRNSQERYPEEWKKLIETEHVFITCSCSILQQYCARFIFAKALQEYAKSKGYTVTREKEY